MGKLKNKTKLRSKKEIPQNEEKEGEKTNDKGS